MRRDGADYTQGNTLHGIQVDEKSPMLRLAG
jgi:hypothetical protein